jgi:hypothetical protein
MLIRTAVGLAIVLAAVSGSLASPRTHAKNARTASGHAAVFSGTETGPGSFSVSEPTVWGWRYTPPQEQAHR